MITGFLFVGTVIVISAVGVAAMLHAVLSQKHAVVFGLLAVMALAYYGLARIWMDIQGAM